MTLDELDLDACRTPSDIHEHLPTLRLLASDSDVVVELGTGGGFSTRALLAAQPNVLITCDLCESDGAKRLKGFAGRTTFHVVQEDSRKLEFGWTDMLFIDTHHTAEQLTAELDKHSGKVRKWIAMHDTVTYDD